MRDVKVSLGFKNPTLEQKKVDVSAALLKELRLVCPVVTRFVTDVLSVAAADTKCRLNSSCFKICHYIELSAEEGTVVFAKTDAAQSTSLPVILLTLIGPFGVIKVMFVLPATSRFLPLILVVFAFILVVV